MRPVRLVLQTTGALSLCGMAAAPGPAGIRCQNAGLAVRCSDGLCEARQVFTPLSLTLDGRALSICFSSGCFEGKAQIHHRPPVRRATSTQMPFQGPCRAPRDVSSQRRSHDRRGRDDARGRHPAAALPRPLSG